MREKENDKIPMFSSWTGWYLFVGAVLLLLILLFFLITKRFA